jgi:type IV secretion system protein VirB1
MDPAAFTALLERCAPGAAARPLMEIVRQASAFEPLLITIDARKPINIQATSLEEGVQLATEASVVGQTVRIGLAQLDSEERKQAGLTISASFDACKHVAGLHALYQARLDAARARATDPEKATASAVASFIGNGPHATPDAAPRPQATQSVSESEVARSGANAPPAEPRSTLDVYRSGRGASLFVYER